MFSSETIGIFRLVGTTDYRNFDKLVRFIVSNSSTVRSLSIDRLDVIQRKILIENGFSLEIFSNLEEISIGDEFLSENLTKINFAVSTLKILRLKSDHSRVRRIDPSIRLRSVELTIYSGDLLDDRFRFLVDVRLKVMFDLDLTSRFFFSRLSKSFIETFSLEFFLSRNDINFQSEFDEFFASSTRLRSIELFYQHGFCPINVEKIFFAPRLDDLTLINISPLISIKNFLETNRIDPPEKFFIQNPSVEVRTKSSFVFEEIWFRKKIIVFDFLHCATSSMEIFQTKSIIFSDELNKSQTAEIFLLRSIYNRPEFMTNLKTLQMTRFQLSFNGLIVFLTRLDFLQGIFLSDGFIDRMAAKTTDLDKILVQLDDELKSQVRILHLTNIRMSRRTATQLSLISSRLESLTLDDVKLFDVSTTNNDQHHEQIDFLLLLKSIALKSQRFKWNSLKSIHFGKNLINRHNFDRFLPSPIDEIYSTNIENIFLVVDPNFLSEKENRFVKSMKKLVEYHRQLTSLVIQFSSVFQRQYLLERHLLNSFHSVTEKEIFVYRAAYDRACRFSFQSDSNADSDQSIQSQPSRTLCGIPVFFWKR